MSAVRCRKWILKSHFVGLPKSENVELVEEDLPPLGEGEYLLKAVWLSVDPYMRAYSSDMSLGHPIRGHQVAEVIQSSNDKFEVGDFVLASCGWVDHFICDDNTNLPFGPVTKVSLPRNLLSHALGLLGVTGLTAYFGLLEICHPKEGETLVVNAAAGAVGSVVGQIAKIRGCRVVGFAGSDAKVSYMKSLGFDAAYNYKTITSLKETLEKACPKGVDIFFDNVGGEFFSVVIGMMNLFGRVAVCGAISEYNQMDDKPMVRSVALNLVLNQIRVEGFIVSRWINDFPTALMNLKTWMEEGRVKTKEHVTDGFENMFDAFLGLFHGENTGKSVVKA